MKLMTTNETLEYKIYPNLDITTVLSVFSDLNPQDKGRNYQVNCPKCSKREAYVYKNNFLFIGCSRKNECGKSTSIWNYLQEKDNLSQQETFGKLAELAGHSLPELHNHITEEMSNFYKKANMLEEANNLFKGYIKEEKNKGVLNYLTNTRGYNEEEITSMELGLFPKGNKLETDLKAKGFIIPEMEEAGLLSKGLGTDYQLTIPYRNPSGHIKGFIIRTILSEEDRKAKDIPKYKNTKGTEFDSLFNLNKASGLKDLIVCEGPLDSLIATEKGIKGVVSTCTNQITGRQIEDTIKRGIKSLTLFMDSDTAGQKGTERTIHKLVQTNLNVYVVSLSSEYKDPDELLRTKGKEIFEESLSHVESAYKWIGESYIRKRDTTKDIERDKTIEEALAFHETISDPLNAKDFLDVIKEGTDIPEAVLSELALTYNEKKARTKQLQGYKDFAFEFQSLVEEGNSEQIKELIDDRIPKLRSMASAKPKAPYSFDELLSDIRGTREGLKTGFEELDKKITIPQEAITIVAGRPSHGKTTLLLNLLLNMANIYEDRTFLFFSYEESKRQIGLKLINILAEEIIDEAQNLKQIENYLRGPSTSRNNIEIAKKEFKELAEDKRIWIIDESYFIEDLIDALAYFNERYSIGAVFIDYIQKIKIKNSFATRQLEIQRISELILEASKSLSLPIILGAQLGRDKEHANKVRLDNLRESGDIEQDANLVIGLHNDAMEKAQDREEPLTISEVDIILSILKNRNGMVNESIVLTFNRPTLKISDKEDTYIFEQGKL